MFSIDVSDPRVLAVGVILIVLAFLKQLRGSAFAQLAAVGLVIFALWLVVIPTAGLIVDAPQGHFHVRLEGSAKDDLQVLDCKVDGDLAAGRVMNLGPAPVNGVLEVKPGTNTTTAEKNTARVASLGNAVVITKENTTTTTGPRIPIQRLGPGQVMDWTLKQDETLSDEPTCSADVLRAQRAEDTTTTTTTTKR
jgi:hypothetical protein